MSYNQRIEKKLNKICTITSSKRIYRKEYEKSGIPFYRSKEVIQKHNNEPIDMELFISKERYHEIKTQFGVPKKGDILLTSVGTLGIPYYIDNDEKFYFKDGNLTWFKDFSNEIHSKYLYYYLLSSVGKEKIDQITIGSTQKAITIQGLKSIKILMPSKNEQVLVTKILSSIDDKIKLNNKINNNLEELAQTLYKHWFVDFEFPNEEGLPYKSSGGKMVESELGLIPEGWSVIKLNDIIDYSNGYAFKSKDYEETGKYKVITIRNVKDGKFDLSNVSKVHKIPERIREDQILIIGDILMSLTGNVGRVAIVDEDNCLLNQRVAKISSLDSNYKGFIYFILRNNEIFNKIVSLGKGSAQQNLSPIEMLKIKMTLPKSVDNIVLNKFNTMFNILIHNEIENKKLTKLRDILLPKLMSGEIRVPIKE